MITLHYAVEKTNSYRPTPWHWSLEPFPAWRGNGARYSAFLACAAGYAPADTEEMRNQAESYRDGLAKDMLPTKLIKTVKGTLLLVPCSQDENEHILLITARGGFRGGFGRIEAVQAEILFRRDGDIHCVATSHMVARLSPCGYVYTETGRRCSDGDIEVFSWEKYLRMPAEEFAVWREQK